jgi:hypothetical protein
MVLYCVGYVVIGQTGKAEWVARPSRPDPSALRVEGTAWLHRAENGTPPVFCKGEGEPYGRSAWGAQSV